MSTVIALDNICWITNASSRVIRFERFPSEHMVCFGGMVIAL